jgi:hypothetical protein
VTEEDILLILSYKAALTIHITFQFFFFSVTGKGERTVVHKPEDHGSADSESGIGNLTKFSRKGREGGSVSG